MCCGNSSIEYISFLVHHFKAWNVKFGSHRELMKISSFKYLEYKSDHCLQ